MIPFCSSRSPTIRTTDAGRRRTSDDYIFACPAVTHVHQTRREVSSSLLAIISACLNLLNHHGPTVQPTDRPTASNVKVRSRWLLSFCYSNGPGSHTCTTDYTTLARYVRTHTRFVYWMGLPTREHPPGKVVSRSAARPVSTHQLFQAKAKHCVLRY